MTQGSFDRSKALFLPATGTEARNIPAVICQMLRLFHY